MLGLAVPDGHNQVWQKLRRLWKTNCTTRCTRFAMQKLNTLPATTFHSARLGPPPAHRNRNPLITNRLAPEQRFIRPHVYSVLFPDRLSLRFKCRLHELP